MASLFDLAMEFRGLNDLAEELEYNEETGEILDNSETVKELFNSINEQLGDKLDNTMLVIKSLEAQQGALKAEAQRLSKRATTLGNRMELLRALMLSALQQSEQTKLKTTKFNYSIRKSKSVEVKEVEDLPRNMVRIKREADKKKIKEALENGEEVIGCSIVEKENLGVK